MLHEVGPSLLGARISCALIISHEHKHTKCALPSEHVSGERDSKATITYVGPDDGDVARILRVRQRKGDFGIKPAQNRGAVDQPGSSH